MYETEDIPNEWRISDEPIPYTLEEPIEFCKVFTRMGERESGVLAV